CCSGVGLAVARSMPRYTHMESTETISQSPRWRATANAVDDLPEAVTPTRATALIGSSAGHRDAHAVPGSGGHLQEPARKVVRVTGRDGRGRQCAGGRRAVRTRRGRREVHQLALTGAAAQHGIVALA